MRKKGLLVKQMGEDGACLFRAVADQVYGDQEMHAVVRKHCMDYIVSLSRSICMFGGRGVYKDLIYKERHINSLIYTHI